MIDLYEAVVLGDLTPAEASAIGEARVRAAIAAGRKPHYKRDLLHLCPICGYPVAQANVGGRGARTEMHAECKTLHNDLSRVAKALHGVVAAHSDACGCPGGGPRCYPGRCPVPRPRLHWHQAKHLRSQLWSLANTLNPLCKGVDNANR